MTQKISQNRFRIVTHLPQEKHILRLSGSSGLLLHSVFWDKFLMRPTFPILPDLQSEYLFSKFLPRSKYNHERFLVIISFRFDEFSFCLSRSLGDMHNDDKTWSGIPGTMIRSMRRYGRRCERGDQTCWWSGWDKLPTLASNGYEFAQKHWEWQEEGNLVVRW